MDSLYLAAQQRTIRRYTSSAIDGERSSALAADVRAQPARACTASDVQCLCTALLTVHVPVLHCTMVP